MGLSDVESWKLGIDTFRAAIAGVGDVLRLIPKGSDREKVEQALKEAEKKAAEAEAQMAQGLGYKLCRSHFPPVVMLERFDEEADVRGYWACPECGREDPPEQERRALPHRITLTSW